MPESLIDLAGLQVGAEEFLAAVLETTEQPIWVVDGEGADPVRQPGCDRRARLRARRRAVRGATATRRSTTGTLTARRSPPTSARCCGRSATGEKVVERAGLVRPPRRIDVPRLLRLGPDRDAGGGPRRGRGLHRHRGPHARRATSLREHERRSLAAQQASLRRVATLVAGGATSRGRVRRHRQGGRATSSASRSSPCGATRPTGRRPWSAPGAIGRTRSRSAPAGRSTDRRSARASWRPAGPRRSTTSRRSPARSRTPPARRGSARAPARRSSSTARSGARCRPTRPTARRCPTTSRTGSSSSRSSSPRRSRPPRDRRSSPGSPTSRRRCGGSRRSSRRACPPSELFAAVTEEVGRLLGADAAATIRYEPGGMLSAVGSWTAEGVDADTEVGRQWPLAGESLAPRILKTGRPARIDDWRDVPGPIGDYVRTRLRLSSSVGSPIVVEGRVWGNLAVHSTTGPLPRDTEARIARLHRARGDGDHRTRRRGPRCSGSRTSRRRCGAWRRWSRASGSRRRSSPRSPRRWAGCCPSRAPRCSATRTTGPRPSSPAGVGWATASRSGRGCPSTVRT